MRLSTPPTIAKPAKRLGVDPDRIKHGGGGGAGREDAAGFALDRVFLDANVVCSAAYLERSGWRACGRSMTLSY